MSNVITVDFRNDTLFAVERDDGVFVALKPICDSIGLSWKKQQERLKRDPILAEGATMVVLSSVDGLQCKAPDTRPGPFEPGANLAFLSNFEAFTSATRATMSPFVAMRPAACRPAPSPY